MKMKLLLTLAFLLLAAPGAFAQAAGADAPKTKIGMIDWAAIRQNVVELKAKYDKLQAEFLPKSRDLESMANAIANPQKVAQENKTLTPPQAQALNEKIEQLKK